MKSIIERINKRLSIITESVTSSEVIRAQADRQYCEDILFHTIGPLTENPTWVKGNWTSPSEPPADFAPGGPAPRWTQDEVVFAMAGDVNLAGKPGLKDNPRSPSYGNKGGAPLWRMARKVSRIYARGDNLQFIMDMYSNGLISLTRLMQPGYDQSRSPFISYVTRTIMSSMENGIGGTNDAIRATGGDSTSGVRGLTSLSNVKTPQEALEIANQIKGKYRTTKSHDKNPDNPFGQYSSRIYQLATAYAQALESQNEDNIDKIKTHIAQLSDDINDEQVFVPGAATGMGQAISTPDRKTHIGVSSMDVKTNDGDDMSGNIAATSSEESWIDPEAVFYILDIALAQDMNSLITRYPWVKEVAIEAGLDDNKNLGTMTANELRYVIRQLGPLASEYPGKGIPRANTQIKRDAQKWWKPMEDPEIEPLPNGGMWKSIWSRNGYEAMGPTGIADEMTKEVLEFNQLNIPTAREVKVKGKISEAISKVSVANTVKTAFIKLKVIATLNKESFGVHKDLLRDDLKKAGFPILEDYDPIDRKIIFETLNWMLNKISKNLVLENVNKTRNTKNNNIVWSVK